MKARLTSQPGFEEEVATSNPTPINAEIVVNEANREKHFAAFPHTLKNFGDIAKLDERAIKTTEYDMQGTRIKEASSWPDGMLSVNVDPYKQLIAKYMMDNEFATIENLYDYLTTDQQVMKRGSWQRSRVIYWAGYPEELSDDIPKGAITGQGQDPKSLHRRGVIKLEGITEDGVIYGQGHGNMAQAFPGWGANFVKYKKGRHLVKQKMHRFVKKRGPVDPASLINYVTTDLRWASTEATKNYLDQLLTAGVFKGGDNYVEVQKPLPSIKNDLTEERPKI